MQPRKKEMESNSVIKNTFKSNQRLVKSRLPENKNIVDETIFHLELICVSCGFYTLCSNPSTRNKPGYTADTSTATTWVSHTGYS